MTKGITVPRHDSDCALCRVNDADEVGSHLAPNFIIHKAFSFDGKGKRDHEISYLIHLNDPAESTYYARDVRRENIVNDLGHEMTDEELEQNINNLVYDNLFCKRCEKRFGILETEYSRFYNDGKMINARAAYLFWLSVFWRMSVGHMAIDMDIRDELEIRTILDRNITTLADMESSDADLGNFGFICFRCRDVMKGDSGIFGTRARHIPYIVILNDLVVALVRDTAKSHNIAYKSIKRDYVNSWTDDDFYVEDISLEDFARMKRWILDESYRNGFGPIQEKMVIQAQEYCRHKGDADLWEMFEDAIDEARSQDHENRPNLPMLRNIRRFYVAEIKAKAAERAGRDYDILKDRSLMIFQFDIDNYRSDLLKYARKDRCISQFPFAKKLVPRKYWEDEADLLDENDGPDYDEIIDKILNDGFTLNDIIDRNCCTKEADSQQ